MAEHNVKILGFGDNVVDMYEHLKTMYPGGNCVNLCAYAKRFGVEKSAYMGYFGNDDNAEYVIKVLEEIGIEMYKCKQLDGENGWSKVTLKDGDRVFIDWNKKGVTDLYPFEFTKEEIEYIKEFDIACISWGARVNHEKIKKLAKYGVKICYD